MFMNPASTVSCFAASFTAPAGARQPLFAAVALTATMLIAIPPAQAQQQASPQARVIVIGQGSVSVKPDCARIRAGVTTTAKTAKAATDANAKLMTAVTATLLNAGIGQKDIQTVRFSLQPVYASMPSHNEAKLTGFSVANEVNVTVRRIDTIGEILDRLVAAGATDIGGVELLRSDPAKALDQAWEAAIADARRKAELYAKAAGLKLGRVAWITEDSAYAPPGPFAAMRASARPSPVPIATGENTFRVQVTAGFDTAP